MHNMNKLFTTSVTTIGGESYMWEKFRKSHSTLHTCGKDSRLQQCTVDTSGI